MEMEMQMQMHMDMEIAGVGKAISQRFVGAQASSRRQAGSRQKLAAKAKHERSRRGGGRACCEMMGRVLNNDFACRKMDVATTVQSVCTGGGRR